MHVSAFDTETKVFQCVLKASCRHSGACRFQFDSTVISDIYMELNGFFLVTLNSPLNFKINGKLRFPIIQTCHVSVGPSYILVSKCNTAFNLNAS